MKRDLTIRALPWIAPALLIFCLCLQTSAEQSLDDLARRLVKGDKSVIPALLRRPRPAVAALKRIEGKGDLNILIKQLGAESGREREAATQQLLRWGEAAKPAVREHLKKHGDDPEITARCKRILDADSGEAAQAAASVAAFLIQVKGLEKDDVLPFAENYHAWMETCKFPKALNQQFIRFLEQYAVVPGAPERVAAKLKNHQASWSGRVARIFLDRAPDDILLPFVRHSHLRAHVLTALVRERKKKITDAQWQTILDVLLKAHNDGGHFFWCRGDEFPEFFRKNARKLMKAPHPALRCLGLTLYAEDWRTVREHVEKIYDSAASGWYRENLNDIEVSKRNAGLVLEVVMSQPKTFLRASYLETLAQKADPFPDKKIMAHVLQEKNISKRAAWVRILVKRKPEAKAALATGMIGLLDAKISMNQKWRIVRAVRESCGQQVGMGKFDETWTNMRPTKGIDLADWRTLGIELRVSHKLLLQEVKALGVPDVKKEGLLTLWGRVQMLNYVFTSPDKEMRQAGADYFLNSLSEVDHKYFRAASFIEKVMAVRPASAPSLLERKLSYFEQDDAILFNCMTQDFGRHIDDFRDVTGLVVRQQDVVALHLQGVPLENAAKWFPYVAILSMDRRAVAKHGKVLRKLLLAALPDLQGSPWDMLAAVMAAKATGLKGKPIDDAAIALLKSPPEHGLLDLHWILDERNADLLPRLLKLADEGYTEAMCAAIAAAPNSKKLLQRLTKGFLVSKDHRVAMNCAQGLGYLGKLPALTTLPKKRLDWLLNEESAILGDCEQLIDAISRKEDAVLVARKLAPLLSRTDDVVDEVNEDEHQVFDDFLAVFGLDLSSLISDWPAAQKEVIGKVVSMLKSGDTLHRDIAIGHLSSCSEVAAPYIKQIHECLINEQDQDQRRPLLRGIAQIGLPAKQMELTVRSMVDTEDGNALFCLANIAQDPKDRANCLKRLMAGRFFESSKAGLVGGVKGQELIVRPFLIDAMLNGRQTLGPRPKQSTALNIEAREAVWALARRPDHPDIHKALHGFLKDIATEKYDVEAETCAALCWALNKYCREHLKDLAPQINALPFRYRFSYEYWQLKQALK